MKPMKSLFKTVLIASVATSAALAAHAQTAPPAAPVESAAPATQGAVAPRGHAMRAGDDASRKERRMEHRIEQMQVQIAQHLAALKVKLKLTPAQQGAWSTFSAAVQPTPAQLQKRLALRSEMRALTTPERIDRMREQRVARDAAMDQRFDATKALYAQLSPEQQKTFDANAMRMGGRGDQGKHGRDHGAKGWHDGGGRDGADGRGADRQGGHGMRHSGRRDSHSEDNR